MAIQQLFQQALLFYQQAKYKEASLLLKRITNAVPNHPAGWHLLALTQRKLGDLEDSDRCFNRGFRLSPDDVDLLNNFANLKRQQNKLTEAEQMLRKATKLKPTFVDAWFNLALLLSNTNRHDAACRCFHQVLKTQPAHKAAFLALYREYNKTGQSELATALLANLPDGVTVDVDIAMARAELLRKQGFFDQAIAQLMPWAAHYDAVREMALCHHAAGDSEQAKDLVSKQLELSPTDPALLHLLSELCWQSADGNWLSPYQQAVMKHNAAPIVFLEYADKLRKAGELIAAEQICDAGLKRAPNFSGLLLLKAFLRRESGAFDDALVLLAKCINEATNADEAKSEQVTTLLVMRRNEEAMLLAEQLCQQKPLDQARWALMAACYKLSEKHSKYNRLYDFDHFIGVYNLTSPEGFTDIAAFNQQLLAKLHSLHVNSQHPLQQSLRQGTQTEDDLFLLQHNVIQALKEQISVKVELYIQSLPKDSQHPFLQRKLNGFRYSGAWSVRLKQQGFHRNHYHGDGWISGCYYVSIPDAVNNRGSGWIKFGQPEISKYVTATPDYLLKPEAGLLVLFPSMMWHGTEPFTDEQYRVTVAFDIVPAAQEDE